MESSLSRKFYTIVLILVIFVLATVSHFQIYFEDVLTLAPATEYGIDISIWRIVSEPVLGPLLYLNRTLYVLDEVPLVLFWGLIFYVAFGVSEIFKQKANSVKVVSLSSEDDFLARSKNTIENFYGNPRAFCPCSL